MGTYFAFDPAFTGGVSSPRRRRRARCDSRAPTTTTFTVGTPGTFTVTTVGGGALPTLTVTGALPAGVTFTDNGDRTATLAGTPRGAGGTFPLTFTATSGSVTPVTQAFTLTVTCPEITVTPAGRSERRHRHPVFPGLRGSRWHRAAHLLRFRWRATTDP